MSSAAEEMMRTIGAFASPTPVSVAIYGYWIDDTDVRGHRLQYLITRINGCIEIKVQLPECLGEPLELGEPLHVYSKKAVQTICRLGKLDELTMMVYRGTDTPPMQFPYYTCIEDEPFFKGKLYLVHGLIKEGDPSPSSTETGYRIGEWVWDVLN